MKYMQGMNLDAIDKGYLNSHFNEEEDEQAKEAQT